MNTDTVETTRRKLARWYAELADDLRMLGQHDLAYKADVKVAELEYGGEITIGRVVQ